MFYVKLKIFFLAPSYWEKLANLDLERALNKKIILGSAKNVILFIGDGMGPTTTTSARIYGKGEEGFLAWEKMDNIGVLKVRIFLSYIA